LDSRDYRDASPHRACCCVLALRNGNNTRAATLTFLKAHRDASQRCKRWLDANIKEDVLAENVQLVYQVMSSSMA
jgi:hypothetical protein